MAAWDFKDRFADLVRSGAKTQTIRAERKDKWIPPVGGDFSAWTNRRSRASKPQKLCEGVITLVSRIRLCASSVTIRGVTRDDSSWLESFAQADGFKDWADLVQWFESAHGLPFEGLLIEWRVEDKNDLAKV